MMTLKTVGRQTWKRIPGGMTPCSRASQNWRYESRAKSSYIMGFSLMGRGKGLGASAVGL